MGFEISTSDAAYHAEKPSALIFAEYRLAFLQAMNPAMERKYTMPPPDLTRYKVWEIARSDLHASWYSLGAWECCRAWLCGDARGDVE